MYVINMTDSKFVEAKSEVTHLVEAMKNIKNSTGFDADRLNIIYKEVWHGSTDYRSMRFGIEFIPNSNDHKAVPGLVIELINRNPPDVDQYVNAIVGTQKKVDSVEYDWLSVRPNLEFRFYDRPSTNHLAIDISKTDESFISFLNVGIKERSTAEKLEILFKVADRLKNVLYTRPAECEYDGSSHHRNYNKAVGQYSACCYDGHESQLCSDKAKNRIPVK